MLAAQAKARGPSVNWEFHKEVPWSATCHYLIGYGIMMG